MLSTLLTHISEYICIWKVLFELASVFFNSWNVKYIKRLYQGILLGPHASALTDFLSDAVNTIFKNK